MDDREFMEWFIDAIITTDLYWDTERKELLDCALEKLEQAGKIKRNGWTYERGNTEADR